MFKILFAPCTKNIVLKCATLKDKFFEISENEGPLGTILRKVILAGHMQRQGQKRVEAADVQVLSGLCHHTKGNSELPRMKPVSNKVK
jgi:hypothetical protein